MSKGKRELSADERALWGRVGEGVKARDRPVGVRQVKKAKTMSVPSAAVATKSRLLQAVVAGTPPQDRGAEKRVRRGRVEIAGALDLHGYTQASGRRALGRFLSASFERGDRVVIIITGVGKLGEGVLKKRLPEWLAGGELRTLVSGVASAHRSHGGAGAFYVFLRPNRARSAD
ncbi:MAG: Smr/MutS family protein [Terricaulis sp.]